MNIDNTSGSIFRFYFFKFIFLMFTLIFGAFAYNEYQFDNHIYLGWALGMLASLFAADTIAMPISMKQDGVEYHHLWRTSFLKSSNTKVISIGRDGTFKWQRKEKTGTMVARGKFPWQLYLVACDPKNSLFDIYK